MKRRNLIILAFMVTSLGMSAQKPITAPAGGKQISDELIGIFFEDISSAADGGLYAELVQNGSFEYSPAEKDVAQAIPLATLNHEATSPSTQTTQHTCVFI